MTGPGFGFSEAAVNAAEFETCFEAATSFVFFLFLEELFSRATDALSPQLLVILNQWMLAEPLAFVSQQLAKLCLDLFKP